MPDLGLCKKLLDSARGKSKKRWGNAGRDAGRGIDQVRAEQLLWRLSDAGVVEVHQRRSRRGDWESYEWRLTSMGLALFDEPGDPVDVEAYVAIEDPAGHPVLQNIRVWLEGNESRADLVTRLVISIGETIRAGRVPSGRLLSVQVGGHTKAVRVKEHRDILEEALGFPLEDVVRLHGRAVLAFGRFSFRVRGQRITGDWSVPWLALTPETLQDMHDLEIGASRLLTVENLVAFEEEVRAGLPGDTIAVFTGGFPHSLEMAFLEKLCQLGIRHVRHWGDLDLGGLRILRHLQERLPVPVVPWRMEPELLDRLPTLPLTKRDEEGLRAWAEDETAPLRELAEAMVARREKAEQEGWFLASLAQGE
ncbi:MAG: DUF2399 domain-containing protein [Deltaproteobacteria bacterium]|nr:DUF2399 domain-containing protein [Deltaproteobacteria bacterium]